MAKAIKMVETNSATDDKPLVIRKTQFSEMFARTGNAVCYRCIKVQELASDCDSAISSRYCRIMDPVLKVLPEHGSLVVFHEIFTFYGQRIAYPQTLSRDPFIPKQLQKCEARALTFDLDEWIRLHKAELEDGSIAYCGHPCGWPADTPKTTLEEFQHQLDMALAPYGIDSEEHYLVKHFTAAPDPEVPEAISGDWEPVE